jgi:hypothetical protein
VSRSTRPAVGWPSNAPAGPETYAAREDYAAPESTPEWPPAIAAGWPNWEDDADSESESAPEPPAGWPEPQTDEPDDQHQ